MFLTMQNSAKLQEKMRLVLGWQESEYEVRDIAKDLPTV